MTKHDCIHATHSALISDILVAHRHPIGMSMCDQSAKILDEDNFLIWKVRKEIIVSRNDFNRTFSQFCNIFFVSFRIPKMDQLLKWIFPLNRIINIGKSISFWEGFVKRKVRESVQSQNLKKKCKVGLIDKR